MNTTEQLIECLKISLKYPKNGYICAEHDVILFSGPAEDDESDSAENNRKILDELGAHWSSEYGGWVHFV